MGPSFWPWGPCGYWGPGPSCAATAAAAGRAATAASAASSVAVAVFAMIYKWAAIPDGFWDFRPLPFCPPTLLDLEAIPTYTIRAINSRREVSIIRGFERLSFPLPLAYSASPQISDIPSCAVSSTLGSLSLYFAGLISVLLTKKIISLGGAHSNVIFYPVAVFFAVAPQHIGMLSDEFMGGRILSGKTTRVRIGAL